MKQIGSEKAQAKQGIQIAQAATGFDDLELVDAHVDDVAVQDDGYLE